MTKMVFTVQVALGHVKEIRETTLKEPDVVANSVMAVGKFIPTPGKELILPEGNNFYFLRSTCMVWGDMLPKLTYLRRLVDFTWQVIQAQQIVYPSNSV